MDSLNKIEKSLKLLPLCQHLLAFPILIILVILPSFYSMEEATALLKWRSTLSNQSQLTLSSWTDDSSSTMSICSNWLGIHCNSNFGITQINLKNAGLSGTLDLFPFSSLPNLTRLDINSNNIHGSLPQDIGNLYHLTVLYLHINNLTGPIPPSLGNLINLKILSLYNNQLTGSIPDNITNLTSLTDLYLNTNLLSGPIPSSIGNLTSIQSLLLHQNYLSGVIPGSIGNLKFVTWLSVANNLLSGPIPSEIESLTNLKSLDLSENRFNMLIPAAIGDLVKLHYLNMSNNELSGSIPSQMGLLVHLSELYLAHNNLSGFINKVFGENMVDLVNVDISYNEFEGPIPNTAAFRKAPFKALQGNKGLCGNKQGLQPCFNPKSSLHRMIYIVLPVVSSVLLLLGLFLVRRRRRSCSQQPPERITVLDEVVNNVFLSVTTFDGVKFYDEIVDATGDFDTKYLVGRGGYGSVFRAGLQSGLIVAVKKFHSISVGNNGQACPTKFLNEIKALTEIRHRNIVRLYGFCSHPRHSFLVYEYLDSGSLFSNLRHESKARSLGWSKRVEIIKGIAHALEYMHHNCDVPVLHRDISSSNILLDSEYNARVSDFGTAKFMKYDTSSWTVVVGTYGYIAPEVAYTGKMTQKCDVYSFGVVAIEVIYGQHPGYLIPLLLSSDVPLLNLLDERLSPPPDQKLRNQLTSIVQIAVACLNGNPKLRPTMKIISNEFQKTTTASSSAKHAGASSSTG